MTNAMKLGCISILAALAGCSTPTHGADVTQAISSGDDGGSTMFSCKLDSDCVVVEDDSSCADGVLVAVNAAHADEYCGYDNADVDCSIPAWSDTRVAMCNFGAHSCQMIDPTQIHCGGFINPNHGCPDGFHCDFEGHVPDVGGSCVADATTTN